MRRGLIALGFCIVAASAPLIAQGRQATPAEATPAAPSGLKEIPSPMLIDISLGAGLSPAGKPRKAFNETPEGTTRAYSDASGYVCDKARIGVVLLRQETKHGKTRVTASTALSTDWLRQHVNLTVAILSAGKEVRRQRWDDLVIGATKGAAVNALGVFAAGIGTSTSKAPAAEWEFTSEEWTKLWAGEAPSLRIILEIPKDKEEGE